MTVDEIKSSNSLFLTPADIAPLIGSDPNKIRAQAQDDPRKLGFNVVVVGTRVKIPRKPFLQFIGE